MTADDLTRRAIIAAHDAECIHGYDACRVWSHPRGPLNKREQAIVEALRVEVETKSVVHECCEARQTAEAELEQLRTTTSMADAAGALILDERNAFEDAIERVLALVHAWSGGPCITGYRIPNGDDSDSECLHCAAETIDRALDGTEAADA